MTAEDRESGMVRARSACNRRRDSPARMQRSIPSASRTPATSSIIASTVISAGSTGDSPEPRWSYATQRQPLAVSCAIGSSHTSQASRPPADRDERSGPITEDEGVEPDAVDVEEHRASCTGTPGCRNAAHALPRKYRDGCSHEAGSWGLVQPGVRLRGGTRRSERGLLMVSTARNRLCSTEVWQPGTRGRFAISRQAPCAAP